MFQRISSTILELIRLFVQDRGLWRVGKEEGFELLREMFQRISESYEIPTPSLIEASYEHYLVPADRIGLPRVSLVSALHEYRHHMQKYSKQHYPDIEVDARAWSISAFHGAMPEAFESSWNAGKFGIFLLTQPHKGGRCGLRNPLEHVYFCAD